MSKYTQKNTRSNSNTSPQRWQKMIVKTGTVGVALGAIISSMISPAYAGWGIKDLDVFNKNSGIRKTGRELDQQRLDATAYQFHLHNACPSHIRVKVEYIPRNSSKWKTSYYSMTPAERAYLFPTRNAIVYVSARSSSKYGKRRTWSRRKINMGRNFLKYTYKLTCR